MDRVPHEAAVSGARAAARRGTFVAALLLAVAPGCVSSGQVIPGLGESAQPPVTVVAAYWQNQVIFGVDPVHNGAPMAGLSGRVCLFDKDVKDTRTADGRLVVELYAAPPEHPQGPPVRMEVWEISKETLNAQCLSKDRFGLGGYALNLPWPSYRPDIGQVQMRVRYEPAKGMPVYAAETMLTLNSGPGATPVYTSRRETGDRRPIVTGSPPGPGPQAGAVQQAGAMQPAPPPFPTPSQQAGTVPPTGGVQQVGAMPPAPFPVPPQSAGAVPQVGAMPPPPQAPFSMPGQQVGGMPPPPAQAPPEMPL